MTTVSSRTRRVLAIANLVVALILGSGGIALPTRFWGIDVPLGITVLALLGGAIVSFVRPGFAHKALKISAWVLLAFGLLLVSVVALAMAYLLGIHGEFGAMGALVMALIGALVIPYAVLYPLFGLFVLSRRAELA